MKSTRHWFIKQIWGKIEIIKKIQLLEKKRIVTELSKEQESHSASLLIIAYRKIDFFVIWSWLFKQASRNNKHIQANEKAKKTWNIMMACLHKQNSVPSSSGSKAIAWKDKQTYIHRNRADGKNSKDKCTYQRRIARKPHFLTMKSFHLRIRNMSGTKLYGFKRKGNGFPNQRPWSYPLKLSLVLMFVTVLRTLHSQQTTRMSGFRCSITKTSVRRIRPPSAKTWNPH